MFWCLLIGPIMALYRGYIFASVSSVNEGLTDLERFPRLDLSMFMTSIGLSALPLAIFVMFVLSWVQRRRQVEYAEQQIRSEHQQAIRQLQSAGILRLEWDDPLLADAEFLLSAGSLNVKEPLNDPVARHNLQQPRHLLLGLRSSSAAERLV